MEPVRTCGCWPSDDGGARCGCGCSECSDAPPEPPSTPLRLVPTAAGKDDRRGLRRRRLATDHQLAALGVLVVLSLLALLAWVMATTHYEDARVGFRAPTFSLPEAESGRPYGSADLRGTPSIVVFWSPGCVPCIEELRALQQAWEEHRQAFAVLGIQIGTVGEPPDLALLRDSAITFPNVLDRSGVVAGSFGLMGVPESHFLDADLRVIAVDRGTPVGVDHRRGLVHWSPIPPDVLDRRIAALVATPSKHDETKPTGNSSPP